MDSDELKSNLIGVLDRIDRAASRVGSHVTLVAATKTVSAPLINVATELGVKYIGENRVQEYLNKRDAVTGARWHFIGTLQRNKAKYLVGSVDLIQSVSNAELAREIDRLAAARGTVQQVLAELNAGDEPSKTGAKTYEIDALLSELSALKHIEVRGIMAVPPVNAEIGMYRDIYRVFEKHRGGRFDILSVGMSGDFERAIGEGSNMVRIGSAIFGQRN